MTFFDTSVLVAAMVADHPHHERCGPWLTRAHRGDIDAAISSHTLAELYAVLSTLPVKPRIPSSLAARMVEENVRARFKTVALTAKEYADTIRESAELGLVGGAIYDGLIARAAEKSGAEELVTLNTKDFLRLPRIAEIVRLP